MFKEILSKINGGEVSEEIEAAKRLLEIGVGRNMVVYDTTDTNHLVTDRLYLLLCNVMKTPITDIFYRQGKLSREFFNRYDVKYFGLHEFEIDKCGFFGIADVVWNQVEKYYLNNLQGSFALACTSGQLHEEDRNLVLAVTDSNVLLASY